MLKERARGRTEATSAGGGGGLDMTAETDVVQIKPQALKGIESGHGIGVHAPISMRQTRRCVCVVGGAGGGLEEQTYAHARACFAPIKKGKGCKLQTWRIERSGTSTSAPMEQDMCGTL